MELLIYHPRLTALPPTPNLGHHAKRAPTMGVFLLRHQQQPLALMIVRARKTSMELIPVLALLALMVLGDPVEIHPLLLAFARPITSELETELHAVCALAVEPLLSKRQSHLLPRRTLTALARQTSMGMVPHALIALVALMHLLGPLPLLLAFARPITSELETELHAVCAPTVEPLLSKRQSHLLPRRTLTALARQTRMEMVPHALIALVVLMHLLGPLPLLLAFARPITSELVTELHALVVPTVEPLLSKRQSHLKPPLPLAASAR
jgi:hypothetical protein